MKCAMAIEDLRDMVGKTLLVGITYLDASDQIVDRVEFAGVVTAVEPLVAIEWGDDDPFELPPDAEAFDLAGPGEYRLRSTGEIVVDPDYLTSWTVSAPSA
jgi:hypothetical protein